MEEVLVVVLQGLVEFFIEFVIYFGFDLTFSGRGGSPGCILTGLFLSLGGGSGAVANLLHPRLLMPTEGLRVAALLAPVAAGGLSWLMARYRQSKGRKVEPWVHVLTAALFVLGFDVVRYAYGTH